MIEQQGKFEKWARSNNVQLTLDLDGEYYYPQAKAAWAAWQECHKQVLEVLRTQLRSMPQQDKET